MDDRKGINQVLSYMDTVHFVLKDLIINSGTIHYIKGNGYECPGT